MGEKDIMGRELDKMGDIHSLIASKIPTLDPDDPDSVKEFQALLSLVYDTIAIDGQFGPQTSSYLRNWLTKSDYINSLDTGARETILQPAEPSQKINNQLGFSNDGIARMVTDTAKRSLGTDKVVNEVIDEISIEKMEDTDENA